MQRQHNTEKKSSQQVLNLMEGNNKKMKGFQTFIFSQHEIWNLTWLDSVVKTIFTLMWLMYTLYIVVMERRRSEKKSAKLSKIKPKSCPFIFHSKIKLNPFDLSMTSTLPTYWWRWWKTQKKSSFRFFVYILERRWKSRRFPPVCPLCPNIYLYISRRLRRRDNITQLNNY